MTRHPALSANGSHGFRSAPDASEDHYVPEGWEDLDRGVCPCGELVRWDEPTERWIPDRTLYLLILTPAEIGAVQADVLPSLRALIERQATLNEPLDDEPDDGQVLIAGVLYDRETGNEA